MKQSIQMADWPRSVNAEYRIKYLIQARHDFKAEAQWAEDIDGWTGFTNELMLLVNRSDDGYIAFALDRLDNREVARIDKCFNANEARNALSDAVIVEWAVLQAWADVAS